MNETLLSMFELVHFDTEEDLLESLNLIIEALNEKNQSNEK